MMTEVLGSAMVTYTAMHLDGFRKFLREILAEHDLDPDVRRVYQRLVIMPDELVEVSAMLFVSAHKLGHESMVKYYALAGRILENG